MIPLIIIGVILFLSTFYIFSKIVFILKFFLLIGTGVFVYSKLPKSFKEQNKIAMVVAGIALLAATMTLGTRFGLFTAARMPMAVQQQAIEASVNPIVLVLFLVIMVLTIITLKRGAKN